MSTLEQRCRELVSKWRELRWILSDEFADELESILTKNRKRGDTKCPITNTCSQGSKAPGVTKGAKKARKR